MVTIYMRSLKDNNYKKNNNSNVNEKYKRDVITNFSKIIIQQFESWNSFKSFVIYLTIVSYIYIYIYMFVYNIHNV